jgi:hypothetical protein
MGGSGGVRRDAGVYLAREEVAWRHLLYFPINRGNGRNSNAEIMTDPT